MLRLHNEGYIQPHKGFSGYACKRLSVPGWVHALSLFLMLLTNAVTFWAAVLQWIPCVGTTLYSLTKLKGLH